jgi:hypothetical protein
MKTATRNTITDDHSDEVTEARVLPLPGDANIICGRRGYEREISFRRERNRELAESCRYPLPSWESLRVYFKDGEYVR